MLDAAVEHHLLVRFHPQQQLVHRRLARDDDLMLAAIARRLVQRGIDLARIDVLAADREHIIDPAENALRQPRIGAPAGIRLVDPQRQITRGEADHRLRGAFEVGIDRRAALAVRHAPHGLGIAHLGVDEILPAQHAGGLGRAGDVHPRRHLRHRAGIEHLGAVELGDAVADARDRSSGLTGKEHVAQAEIARIEPFVESRLGKVQRVGRRAVEARRLHGIEPLRAADRHAGRAGAKRKRLGAQPLGAGQRAPAPEIEAEDRSHANHVARPHAHRPHHAGMGIGDGLPVAAADRECRRAPGGAAGAVDVVDLVVGNAQVIAERRRRGLRLAQILLADHRDLVLEILERAQMVGVEACLAPVPAIERRMIVGVAADKLQPLENRLLALARRHGLAPGKPGAAIRRRQIRIVVGWRERPGFHGAPPVSARRARRRGGSAWRRSRPAACPGASPPGHPFS